MGQSIKQLSLLDIRKPAKLTAPISLGMVKSYYQEKELWKFLDKWSRWYIIRKKNYERLRNYS